MRAPGRRKGAAYYLHNIIPHIPFFAANFVTHQRYLLSFLSTGSTAAHGVDKAAYCIMSLQVIPEVVDNVLDTVNFSVTYGDNAVSDGQHLRPSQAAVCNCFNQCTSAIVVAGRPSWFSSPVRGKA